MKKKIGLRAALVLMLYMLLLGLLTASESGYETSGIRGFADALWYSLVTITTVGYGDMYPVSPLGRVIGVFFLMLSMGFLAFLMGAMVSLLSGRLLPAIFLRTRRNSHWFLFSEKNAASEALALDLEQRHPDALMVFCSISREDGHRSSKNRLYLSEDICEVLSHFRSAHDKRTAFLISENELRNRDEAYALLESGIELYCCSEEAGATNHISYFNPHECCARRYWKTQPLRREERCVLLAGDGRYAQALINSALISNCRAPLFTAQYHLFGNWQGYLRDHYCLDQVLAVDHEEPGKDALFFHAQPWNADADLLARADRIIFCFDDEDENARCVQQLKRLFAHRAAVYARTSHLLMLGTRFGDVSEIYTAELVMKRRLDRTAEQLHEQYRRTVSVSMPEWNDLDAFKRSSNRAATDHIPTKLRLLNQSDTLEAGSRMRAVEIYKNADAGRIELCRRIEHERWMRFYSLHNWQYAPVRDDAARKHPSLLPYEQLDEAERAKDDLAWQQLEQLS